MLYIYDKGLQRVYYKCTVSNNVLVSRHYHRIDVEVLPSLDNICNVQLK